MIWGSKLKYSIPKQNLILSSNHIGIYSVCQSGK